MKARTINEAMKIAAATAIAGLLREDELQPEYVIPNPFDRRVARAVAEAVALAAVESGVARQPLNREDIAETVKRRLGTVAV